MANNNMDELSRSIQELGNQHIQAMYELTEKHANDLQQVMDIVFEDMIDSYDALIRQRQQCIDKYIKLISFLLQDEIDISKPIQSLVEKKMHDVAELKQEIAPIDELRYLIKNDVDNENGFNKVLERIKNM